VQSRPPAATSTGEAPTGAPAIAHRPALLPLVLAAAVLGISSSGPLARLSDLAPLGIAIWRVALALVVVLSAVAFTGAWKEWRTLSRRDLAIAAVAGLCLALHFWTWIASLGLTTVAASVLLVNLHPVVIVAGSALWLGEKPSGRAVVGLMVALLGAAIVGVTGAPNADGSSPALGNLLAVAGAVTVGLYYLIGRALRARLTLWAYTGLVYVCCLVSLLVFALWQGTALEPQSAREWGVLAAIAFGPMILGHTGFNWSLRYVPAYVISGLLLLEPVIASAVAWLWMGEALGPWTLLGGGIVLVGLVVGTMQVRTLPRDDARQTT
jgi:drug/metabolite transporter (DMT)-like permease